MYEGNQAVEPLRHGRAPAKGSHILKLVQDQQHK
uniref:Uncharacterized protein n=1 Tax=Arundo donax TaxID=35708 RepID=A0A0A9BNS7_ARUDO